jgi:sec-independent protein translocase protein TatC
VENLENLELGRIVNKYYPFLVEVRKRILITVVVFFASTLFGFFFYENIIRFLIEILGLKTVNIVFTSPFQFINLAISCGIASGIILSFPLLLIQVLFFLKPALQRKEFRMVLRFIPVSFILFLIGFAFGALIMRWQIEIFLSKSVSLGIGNILDISRLLSTVIMTSALMGISFEFPILLLLLMGLGIVKRKFLSKIRPWFYLGSFLFAILLPPDSILADILLSLPLIILFELTLILSRVFQKKQP